MLGTLLNSHPQIKCFGELMRKTPRWMLEQGYRGALRILDKLDEYKDDQVRFSRPYDFINAVFATKPKILIKGFKLHTDQHPDFLELLLRDPEYTVIVLQRDNILAQYSSGKIAETTGQGNAPRGAEIKRARVEFNSVKFNRFVESVEENFKKVRALLAESGKKHFELKYAQLNDQDRLSELVLFLGADPTTELQAGTEKRNSSDILSRFVNPDDARRAIDEMGRPEWARESV